MPVFPMNLSIASRDIRAASSLQNHFFILQKKKEKKLHHIQWFLLTVIAICDERDRWHAVMRPPVPLAYGIVCLAVKPVCYALGTIMDRSKYSTMQGTNAENTIITA